MKANFSSYAAKGLAAGIAAAALQFSAPAHAFSTGSYDLFNHPDGQLTQASGAQNQVVYGLRSDAFCTTAFANCGTTVTNQERTFTVENAVNGYGDVVYAHNVSAVWLDWEKSNASNPNEVNYTTARIHGTILWNDDNPSPSTSDVWTIEYNLTNIQSLGSIDPTALDAGDADTYGWYVDSANASGTMTRVSDGEVIYLKGVEMMGAAFKFAPDGHRCDTDTGGAANYGNFPDGSGGSSRLTSMCDPTVDTELVARGWFYLKYWDPTYGWKIKDSGTNDFLLVAKPKDEPPPPDEIPEPGTLALFGIGLVGLRFARRRRTA